jgi:hypothetical protein
LQIKLHPGRDGGADYGDAEHHELRVHLHRRDEGAFKNFAPVGLGHDTRYNVAEIYYAGEKKHHLHEAVAALRNEYPYEERPQGHYQVLAYAEHLPACGPPGELRHGSAEVGDEEPGHHIERSAHAVVFPD